MIPVCSSTPLVSKDELHQTLKALPAWSLNAEGTHITRSFIAKNFVAAINFFEAVGQLAEEAGHHPDLHLTSYRDVEVGSLHRRPDLWVIRWALSCCAIPYSCMTFAHEFQSPVLSHAHLEFPL